MLASQHCARALPSHSTCVDRLAGPGEGSIRLLFTIGGACGRLMEALKFPPSNGSKPSTRYGIGLDADQRDCVGSAVGDDGVSTTSVDGISLAFGQADQIPLKGIKVYDFIGASA